ncbi:hypothetical protein YPPY96_1481, partial [Yersinia pestis PY-96]
MWAEAMTLSCGSGSIPAERASVSVTYGSK